MKDTVLFILFYCSRMCFIRNTPKTHCLFNTMEKKGVSGQLFDLSGQQLCGICRSQFASGGMTTLKWNCVSMLVIYFGSENTVGESRKDEFCFFCPFSPVYAFTLSQISELCVLFSFMFFSVHMLFPIHYVSLSQSSSLSNYLHVSVSFFLCPFLSCSKQFSSTKVI